MVETSVRRRPALGLMALLGLSVLSPFKLPVGGARADVVPGPGSILAPVSRQAGWLNLEAPRPRPITNLPPPAYVTDLSVPPSGLSAALAVQQPLNGRGELGGDLLRLDLSTGALSSLLPRGGADESLGAPVWRFDGSAVLYQREDVRGPATAYPGQGSVRYPSRVEQVQADGSARTVLVEDGRQPAPSPDGTQLAYLRSSVAGTALLMRTVGGTDDRELVPVARFPDLAYPRFSPRGDQIAFVAAALFVGGRGLSSLLPFGPGIALAHGLPWDVWLVGLDGSAPRLLATLGGDDASLVWSPDGSQVFVYGGSGSAIIDVSSGEVASYSYLAGYGATAWLPIEVP